MVLSTALSGEFQVLSNIPALQRNYRPRIDRLHGGYHKGRSRTLRNICRSLAHRVCVEAWAMANVNDRLAHSALRSNRKRTRSIYCCSLWPVFSNPNLFLDGQQARVAYRSVVAVVHVGNSGHLDAESVRVGSLHCQALHGFTFLEFGQLISDE